MRRVSFDLVVDVLAVSLSVLLLVRQARRRDRLPDDQPRDVVTKVADATERGSRILSRVVALLAIGVVALAATEGGLVAEILELTALAIVILILVAPVSGFR